MEAKIVKKLIMLARAGGVSQEEMPKFLADKKIEGDVLDQMITHVFSMPETEWAELKKTFVKAFDSNSQ